MSYKKCVVIVDAFSAGRFLASAFKEKGYQCVHVFKNTKISPAFLKTYQKEDFIAEYYAEMLGYDELVKQLQLYPIDAIVPGAETGVLLAEQLATTFKMRAANHSQLINARRNKYDMQERLKNVGLPHIHQFQSTDVNELIAWQKTHRYNKVIVKPVSSASSHNVTIAYQPKDIQAAFDRIRQERNVTGESNDTVLIQAYCEGDEYMVNSLSSEGQHLIIEVWKGIGKNPNKISCDDYAEQVLPDAPEYNVLIHYAAQVLDALGIVNGAAHSEIMLTTHGPVLIETGARLSGFCMPNAIEAASGINPIERLVDAYVDPNAFKSKLSAQHTRSLPTMPHVHALTAIGRRSRIVYFSSTHEAIAQAEPDLSAIKNLPSCTDVRFSVHQGEMLHITETIPGRQGFAYLTAECPEQLTRDYKTFRELEEQLYQQLRTGTK